VLYDIGRDTQEHELRLPVQSSASGVQKAGVTFEALVQRKDAIAIGHSGELRYS
jgi:hypothetical protein